MDPEQLNHWLSVFVVETRQTTGEPYPPATIHSILSGILRYMRSLDAQMCPNFFEKGLEVTKSMQNPSLKKRKSSFGPQERSV